MISKIKEKFVILKGTAVSGLKFLFEANTITEKIFWSILDLIGFFAMIYLIFSQIETLCMNPTLSSRKWVDLSEINLPAITFCHQGNTRMEIAERLLQATNGKSSRDKELRNIFLKESVHFFLQMDSNDFKGKYVQYASEISSNYKRECQLSNVDDQCNDCMCNYYNVGFGYAKDHNLTMGETYEKILSELKNEDDISIGLTKIWSNMANSSGKYNITEHLDSSSEEWLIFENIDVLFSIAGKTQLKMPMNFGKMLMQMIGPTIPFNLKTKNFDEIYNFFSLPNNELNLMTISHLYTMNDFEQFGRYDLFSLLNEEQLLIADQRMNSLSLGGVPKPFRNCFKETYQDVFGSEEENVVIFEETNLKNLSFLSPSICQTINQDHQCQAYCQWHKTFFDQSLYDKREFFAMMKLSQPQRKLLIPAFSKAEMSLTKKVFGLDMSKSQQNQQNFKYFASMPLIIFCKDKLDQDWLGDDIGLSSKFCSDFYPTPTDQGLCQTKNLNYEALIRLSDGFNESFDTNQQKSSIPTQVDRLNAKATFIIATNAGDAISKTFSRSKKVGTNEGDVYQQRQQEMKEVQFQIHPANELPQILKDSYQGAKRDSLTLKAGHEYFIELTPYGQIVTSQFKSLEYADRHCSLSNEKSELSAMKVYSKQNCRYECKVHIAIENCNCIPWDFPINTTKSVMECDVFGRTCFFNAMRKINQAERNQCPQCDEDCEFMQYHKSKVVDKEIQSLKFDANTCKPKYLCEYLLDTTGNIDPVTWYEEFKDFRAEMEGKTGKMVFKWVISKKYKRVCELSIFLFQDKHNYGNWTAIY